MRAKPTAIDATRVIDQNAEQQCQAVALRHLVWKLDRRLIPFLTLLEMSSYINRSSIGHAKLMGLETDLHMSPSEINWAISLFFLGYLIFGIPSCLFVRFLGPSRYLSLSTILWGTITVGMAFVKDARQLLIIRFLLGTVESGFFPSMIIYFSLWYCKKEQTMRIGILYGAAIVSNAIGGILAHGISQMEGIGSLKGWQWTFLLEGLPNIPLGVVTYLFLANIPDTVRWLDNCEKQQLTNLLREDAGIINSESTSNTRLSWRQVRYVFIDWRIYLYAAIGFGDLGVSKYLATYFPSLIEDMGLSKAQVHLMTAPPYAIAFVCCLLAAYSSSCRNEHSFHLIFCLSVALVGFILMLTLINQGKAAIYISACVACSGTFAAVPLIWSWLTNNVGGHTKRAVAVGFVICISQIGGAILPHVYSNADKPIYRRGNLICVGLLIFSLVATFILRFCLILENRRRDNLSLEQYKREVGNKEPCDWHPDARYGL